MELNWLSIADTAIKIGLGSLIAAVSGYMVLRKTHSYEDEKELQSRFYELQEKKKRVYVEFLSQSQSLVQSHVITSCMCDTNEYKDYLRSFNELQIISSDKVRVVAYDLLFSVNAFIVINKNGLEIELEKNLRKAVDANLGLFQKIVQIEVTKPYAKT